MSHRIFILPLGQSCPLCGQPPVFLLGGGRQAFCGTGNCPVITWDPADTLADFISKASFVDLEPWRPGGEET